MKVFVKAKTGAKEEKVSAPLAELWQDKNEKIELIVSVKELPINGKANAAISKVLAKHFKVSPSQVSLLSGFSSKHKVFEVL